MLIFNFSFFIFHFSFFIFHFSFWIPHWRKQKVADKYSRLPATLLWVILLFQNNVCMIPSSPTTYTVPFSINMARPFFSSLFFWLSTFTAIT